jgi:hypothetical protein
MAANALLVMSSFWMPITGWPALGGRCQVGTAAHLGVCTRYAVIGPRSAGVTLQRQAHTRDPVKPNARQSCSPTRSAASFGAPAPTAPVTGVDCMDAA